eukprot:6181628-Pleurochrysis_carterae.AAC.3
MQHLEQSAALLPCRLGEMDRRRRAGYEQQSLEPFPAAPAQSGPPQAAAKGRSDAAHATHRDAARLVSRGAQAEQQGPGRGEREGDE